MIDLQQEAYAHLAKAFTSIPFNRMLGLQLEEMSSKHASMNFVMKEELIGNFLHGILHGGVISAVLDMAGGMVVMANTISRNTHLSNEELAKIIGKCSTVDLQVSYLRPGKGSLFTAKATLTKSGNKISFAQMELFNDSNQLIATASGTYLVQ